MGRSAKELYEEAEGILRTLAKYSGHWKRNWCWNTVHLKIIINIVVTFLIHDDSVNNIKTFPLVQENTADKTLALLMTNLGLTFI